MPRQKSHITQTGSQWDLPEGSRVWLYLRHSPGDKQTIDSQLAAMLQWCEENSWLIDRKFIDEAIEGSREDRQQFQEMMALYRQQPRTVDGVVIWSFSRFARDQLDSQFYKADLRKRGFVVVSKIDDIPNNEIAPIIEAVVDWKNQRFLEDLSADVCRGLAYLADQGYWPKGKPPLGYVIEKVVIGERHNGTARFGNHLIKDMEVADKVRLAWDMKLSNNASYYDIHEATHLFSSRNRYGTFFDNMIYAGVLTHSGKRYPNDWQQGKFFCDPYVTLEEYQRVQSLRHERTFSVVAPRLLSSRYLLTGLLRCGVCAEKGRKSSLIGGTGGKSKPDYRYYVCKSRQELGSGYCSLPHTSTWIIDEPIVEAFCSTVLTSDYVRRSVERANEMLLASQKGTKITLAQAERMELVTRRKVENLIDLIGRKGATPLLESQYDFANQAWQQAVERLAELKDERTLAQIKQINSTEVLAWLTDALLSFQEGVAEEKRALLAAFIDHIDVFPDHLCVHYKFRLDSSVPQDPQKRQLSVVFSTLFPGSRRPAESGACGWWAGHRRATRPRAHLRR